MLAWGPADAEGTTLMCPDCVEAHANVIDLREHRGHRRRHPGGVGTDGETPRS